MPDRWEPPLSATAMPGELRKSDKWRKWAAAMSPVVLARRRLVRLLGNKEAAKLCFDVVAAVC